MEVTTVFPLAISPTEGDDLCEPDVTTVATHSVTLLIGLCGLAGNRTVLWLPRLKGVNSFIRAIAFINFHYFSSQSPLPCSSRMEDMSCSPLLPHLYLRFLFWLSVFSSYWIPLFLTVFDLVEFIKKLWKLYCRRDLPDDLTWALFFVQFGGFSALFTEIPTLTSQCPSNEQEHCRAALITMWVIILLLLVVPMTVLVISRTIHLIKAKCGSQQQEPEGLDIVIISIGLFTLFFILCNFLQQLGYTVLPYHFFLLLTCINSSIKPFIYFLVGRCRSCSVQSLRRSLQRVFEEPEEKTAHSNDPAMDTGV